MKLSKKQLIQLVKASFTAEKEGDVEANKKLIHENFLVTDMVFREDGNHFPTLSGEKLHELMDEAFKIEGRQYDFKHMIADEDSQTVMVEFIETYPEPVTNQVYVTPQVAICEIKDGKIFRTRHYMDPRVPRSDVSIEDVQDKLE